MVGIRFDVMAGTTRGWRRSFPSSPADQFHVGNWLSVYDEAQARALDSPARPVFQRVHETMAQEKAPATP
jgi:hypothetical protein